VGVYLGWSAAGGLAPSAVLWLAAACLLLPAGTGMSCLVPRAAGNSGRGAAVMPLSSRHGGRRLSQRRLGALPLWP
jgi:hypothetical protein